MLNYLSNMPSLTPIKSHSFAMKASPAYWLHALALSMLSLGSGCATTPLDHQLLVAEVVHLYSRQEIDVGATFDGVRLPPMRSLLQKNGYAGDEIVEGSAAIVRTAFYRNNQASGILHELLKPSLVQKGLALSEGNVVEIKIDKGTGTIVKVRYRNLQEGECKYRLDERNDLGKSLDFANPAGGPSSESLYCPALAGEGWQPRQFGPYDAKGWFKSP